MPQDDLEKLLWTVDELTSWTGKFRDRARPAPGPDAPAADRRRWTEDQRRRVASRRRRLLTAHENLMYLCRAVRAGDVVAVDGAHPTRDVAEVLAMAADVRAHYTMCSRLLAVFDHVLATAG